MGSYKSKGVEHCPDIKLPCPSRPGREGGYGVPAVPWHFIKIIKSCVSCLGISVFRIDVPAGQKFSVNSASVESINVSGFRREY